MPTRTFQGRYASLEALGEFVTQHARNAGLNEKEVYAVQLAVDEAATNIIEHAYGGENRGEIECHVVSKRNEIRVLLKDHGQPFVPKVTFERPVGMPIEQVAPGGVGLFLMRKMMDEVHFDFGKNENIVTLIKRSRR